MRYDKQFDGKKSRNVRQNEIDEMIAEAHGPDSVPQRTAPPSAPNWSSDMNWGKRMDASSMSNDGDNEMDQENLTNPSSTPPPNSAIVSRTQLANELRNAS